MTSAVDGECSKHSASSDTCTQNLVILYKTAEGVARSAVQAMSYRALARKYREVADTHRARYKVARTLNATEELQFNRVRQSNLSCEGAMGVKVEYIEVKPDIVFGFVDMDWAQPPSEICRAPSTDVDPLAVTDGCEHVVKQEPPESPP